MNDSQTATPGDPAMFEPLTGDENNILRAHLSSGWCKQAVVYPLLSEQWWETEALLRDLHKAAGAARQARLEPEAGQ
jgi:hypothetical protein